MGFTVQLYHILYHCASTPDQSRSFDSSITNWFLSGRVCLSDFFWLFFLWKRIDMSNSVKARLHDQSKNLIIPQSLKQF